MLPGISKPWVKWILRILFLTLIAAAVLIITLNGEKWLLQIKSFTWEPDWPLLILSVLLLAVSFFFIPAGWILLCRSAGCKAGSGELRSVWYISQIGRYIPGKVWLFAGRAAFLKTTGMTGLRAASVPFLELLYTASGAGLSAAIPAIATGDAVFSQTGLRIAVIAAGASVLLIPFLKPLQKWLYRLKYGSVPDELPLPDLFGSVRLLLLYLCLWWVRGLVLYLWLKGFGISGVSPLLCFAAAPLSWLAGYIVFLIPGGIGVREAAITALVAPLGSAGPVMLVITGQRLILSVIEVSFALMAAGRKKFFRERNES